MGDNLYQIILSLITIPILLIFYWRLRLKRLKRYFSPKLGTIGVYQKYNGEKLLTINTYAQGVSIEQKSIRQSYWFNIAQEAAQFCQKRKNPQVLMLGLGANTISSLIAQLDPAIYLTIVEFDKQIIQSCREFFYLDQLPNYQLIRADAYQLFNQPQAFNKKFAVIIVDIFTGNPPYVSLKSNQSHFIEKLLPYLKKDGLIIFNRPGHTEESKADSKKLQEYLGSIFKKTELFDIKDPRGYKNSIIMGSIKRSR